MTKRRPSIVISPRLRHRDDVCTIVPLSTTAPKPVCDFHCEVPFDPPLPPPYDASRMWVKADMLSTVCFSRLALPHAGKDAQGKRIYDLRHLSAADLERVQRCFLTGLGLARLTAHL